MESNIANLFPDTAHSKRLNGEGNFQPTHDDTDMSLNETAIAQDKAASSVTQDIPERAARKRQSGAT